MLENKERLIEQQIDKKPEQVISGGMIDVRHEKALPHEVKSWMEKLEEITPPQINDESGQVVLKPLGTQNVKITLPVTRSNFVGGLHKGVTDAGRWLSEFLFRLIKMKKGNVKFKEDDVKPAA